MLRLLQLLTLGLFGLFAVLTVLFQMRVGMTSGNAQRHESDTDDDPAVRKSRRRAVFFAVLAGASLIACIILGALSRVA